MAPGFGRARTSFSTPSSSLRARRENVFLTHCWLRSYTHFVAHRLQPECLRARECEEGCVAKEDRGFASMDRNKQREIASKGGKAAHQKGTAHEWTSEEAREAGRKGGMASHRRKQEQQGGQSTANPAETPTVPNPESIIGPDDLP
ncbi:MAG TPA: KGG domain-containing protein [Vicinamibacterales bacterium]|nr:KGG domain-containing protein [Vicinamibacterales bacterium]